MQYTFLGIILLLLSPTLLLSQPEIAKLGFQIMAVPQEKDSIFFTITEKENFQKKKGLILFIAGSRSVPLFPKMGGQVAPPLPFNYWEFADEYRFVVISKPGVPIMPDTLLQPPMYLDPKTKESPLAYEENNHLSYYVKTSNLVLKKLLEERWVDKKKIYVIGHSEGARVAAKVAATNPSVKKLVFLSCSAFGRAYNFTSEIRKKKVNPQMQNQYAKETMKEVEEELKKGTPEFPFDFLTYNPMDDLVKMNIPILVMFGTNDTQTPIETNDLIYIEFMKRKKRNLTMIPLEGLDHNFFAAGQEFHWDEVGVRFMGWIGTKK